MLSGSASKGRREYYYYYHCSSKCGCRYKANDVNCEYENLLKELCITPPAAEALKIAIHDIYGDQSLSFQDEKSQLLKILSDLNVKLSKARELLINGDLDGSDYKTIKFDCETKIRHSEARLQEISNYRYSGNTLETIVNEAIKTLLNLEPIFKKADIEEKRKIIGSMFHEKITFSELQLRTAKLKDSFEYIYLINKNLKDKKKGQKTFKNPLPHQG